jgi:hypothetical protein
MHHHLTDLAPLLAKTWFAVLVLAVVVLALAYTLRGAREDLDHAFRDRSER